MSIGLIMVLIGLMLPALGRMRAAAREVKSLANLKQSFVVITVYQQHFADCFPYGDPLRLYPASIDPSAISTNYDHFELALRWQVVVRDLAPWDEFAGIWVSPGAKVPSRASEAAWHYPMAHSFVARPELWNHDVALNDAMLNPTRGHEVRYPPSKALMWDGVMAYQLHPELRPDGLLANPMPVMMADGHASTRRLEDASKPILNRLNAINAEGSQPLHNTALGIHGIDFR